MNQLLQNFTERENPDFEIEECVEILQEHMTRNHDDIIKLWEETEEAKGA